MEHTHPLGVLNLLHEARILLHARNPKRLRLRANGVDKVVVRNCRRRHGALDLGLIYKETKRNRNVNVMLSRTSEMNSLPAKVTVFLTG